MEGEHAMTQCRARLRSTRSLMNKIVCNLQVLRALMRNTQRPFLVAHSSSHQAAHMHAASSALHYFVTPPLSPSASLSFVWIFRPPSFSPLVLTSPLLPSPVEFCPPHSARALIHDMRLHHLSDDEAICVPLEEMAGGGRQRSSTTMRLLSCAWGKIKRHNHCSRWVCGCVYGSARLQRTSSLKHRM